MIRIEIEGDTTIFELPREVSKLTIKNRKVDYTFWSSIIGNKDTQRVTELELQDCDISYIYHDLGSIKVSAINCTVSSIEHDDMIDDRFKVISYYYDNQTFDDIYKVTNWNIESINGLHIDCIKDIDRGQGKVGITNNEQQLDLSAYNNLKLINFTPKYRSSILVPSSIETLKLGRLATCLTDLSSLVRLNHLSICSGYVPSMTMLSSIELNSDTVFFHVNLLKTIKHLTIIMNPCDDIHKSIDDIVQSHYVRLTWNNLQKLLPRFKKLESLVIKGVYNCITDLSIDIGSHQGLTKFETAVRSTNGGKVSFTGNITTEMVNRQPEEDWYEVEDEKVKNDEMNEKRENAACTPK